MATIDVCAVGDIILDEPVPVDRFFNFCKDTLRQADLLIGQVEVPHTSRGVSNSTDIQAPPAAPENLEVLRDCGFDIATLSGNHICDCGPAGVTDTYDKLKELGITPQGAGADIHIAKEAAFSVINGCRFGLISYNTVGPSFSYATSQKAGCAYLKVYTHFETATGAPGASFPPKVFTFVDPDDLLMMQDEIAALKKNCDIAIVSLHKGGLYPMGKLEMYERPLARAAVDAGADIVISQHAHRCRGIEIYKGRPIYHGLGNFVCVTYALTPGYHDTEEKLRAAEMRKRAGTLREYECPYQPWAEEAKNVMIAKVLVDSGTKTIADFGFIPCLTDGEGAVHVKDINDGQSVADYMSEITANAGLDTVYRWAEDGSWIRAVSGTHV